MGHGSHKPLDFLNISLNLPISYHSMDLNSKKYTKAYHDFISYKIRLSNYQKSEQTRKNFLRKMNDLIYLNNKIYGCDSHVEDFLESGVSFIKANIGGCGKIPQFIMMVNTRQVIKVN
jgi:hypothetical protein